MSTASKSAKYLILVVEESASSLGFYDSETGEEVGRVALSLWPHEIAVASDGLAYVSNFGVRDYDLSLGHAGNSVSIVDTSARCEIGRLFTQSGTERYWGPHGVKLSPDETHLYVNVERVIGVREPDLSRPGSEFTKLLKFERSIGMCVDVVAIPMPEYEPLAQPPTRFSDEAVAYDVLPGTHNFVFSPYDPNELWLFSGRAGVSIMNVAAGQMVGHMTGFNGAVRSLAFGPLGTLLVSATNEVSLVDPHTRTITKKIGNLGVGQILYSKLTPDEKYILAPAVWEGQLLVIDVERERVIHRLTTGVDPVQVMISPDGRRAYVTHGRTEWLSYIELDKLDTVAGRIRTKGGPNGTAFATWSPMPTRKHFAFAACLPFTGEYSSEGRELRLGYQQWADTVNDSGGLLIDGVPHEVDIVYADTGSATDEAIIRSLTTTLVEQSKPFALLGSFPSTTDRWVGTIANELKWAFVTGLGRDPALFDGAHPYVFGLASSATCELAGVLRAIKHGVSPKPSTVSIVASDKPIHVTEAAATIRFASSIGFKVVSPDSSGGDGFVRHPPGTEDLTDIFARVRDLAPDILLIVSDREDSIAAVLTCEKLHFRPGCIGLSCGISTATFKGKLGRLADGLLGGVPWTDSVFNYAEDRFGSADDYARIYFDQYSEPASFYAAAGSAVGVVLERAIHGGCTTPKDVAAYLRTLNFASFFGRVKFEHSGRNVAKDVYAIQLVEQDGRMREIPLWPPAVSNGRRPRWPFR